MYQRMYGISRSIPARVPTYRLVPIENEPWLCIRSLTPIVIGVLCGTGGVIFATLMLFAWARAGLVSSNATAPNALAGILLLLSCLGVVLSLFVLLQWWITSALRATRQYCPDCLSYMTRGANVCPFCGFRAVAAPPLPLQQAPARQRTRY
jgi:hypothetical protein